MKEKEIGERLESWITKKPIHTLVPKFNTGKQDKDSKQEKKFYELPEELNGSPVKDTEAALGMKITELGCLMHVIEGKTFINRPATDALVLATNPADIALIKEIGGREIVRNSNIWTVRKGDKLFQAYKKFKSATILDADFKKNIESLFTQEDRFVEELMADMKELF